MPGPARPEPTAWHRGRLDRRAGPPELLFGRMYEDSALELDAFEPGGRVLCIASAGCIAFDLAVRGDDVTAVDVNPAQIEYVRARARGEPPRQGKVDRWLARVRRLAPAVGWSRDARDHFCSLTDPAAQLEFWRRRLDTRRLRIVLAVAFSPLRLRSVYAAPFAAAVPDSFGRVLRLRLERGFARHPNASNPHAAALLLGRPGGTTQAPLRLETAGAAEFIERCPHGSFGSFSLSNILDGADDRYAQRLFAAVRRAAAPGAVAILRSFREPANERQARRAADDRALIWGGITIQRFPIYRLRRHPIAISAHFRHSLVLAYAVLARALEPLLPPTLEPDRHGELGFAAAAFVQTERMRPSFLPPALGLDFLLGGYRIFVRVAGRPSLRGLYIMRSDTDRRLLTFFGNALTSYRYRTVDASCRRENGMLEIEVRPGVRISADLIRRPAPLPPGSPFASVAQARRFAGPLPYTFHHEPETGLLLSVRGVRSSWNPEPVAVEVHELAFFTAERFGVEPTLANAFYVGGIDYRWDRGKVLAAAES